LRKSTRVRGIHVWCVRTRCTSPSNAAAPSSICADSTAARSASASARSTASAAALCPRAGAESQNGTEHKNTDFRFHYFLFLNVKNKRSAKKRPDVQTRSFFLFMTRIRQCHACA
jgi:hypothetical protein